MVALQAAGVGVLVVLVAAVGVAEYRFGFCRSAVLHGQPQIAASRWSDCSSRMPALPSGPVVDQSGVPRYYGSVRHQDWQVRVDLELPKRPDQD